jgi:hypothetical protein
MLNFQYKQWIYFVIGGSLITIIRNNKTNLMIHEFNIFLFIIGILFFLIISFGRTKLEWYNAPLYPIMAILVSNLLVSILEMIRSNEWVKINITSSWLPYAFVIFIFFMPYKNIWQKLIEKNYHGFDPANIEASLYLKNILNGKHTLKAEYIANDGYNPHNQFYIHALAEKSIFLKPIDYKNMKGGETVMTFEAENKQYIHTNYEYSIIDEKGMVKLINILYKRPIPLGTSK